MNKLFQHGRPLRGLKYLSLAAVLAALPAGADEGAIEYRENVMSAIGGHMSSAADIARGKVPHQAHFSMHVSALAELSTIADSLFPAGSEGGDALPEIWQNPDDFAGKLDDFETAAADLKAAVDTGGDVGSAFQALGQSCKSCHDDYRAE